VKWGFLVVVVIALLATAIWTIYDHFKGKVMTKRRRTANPTFQRPLTNQEVDPNLPAPRPKGKAMVCVNCGYAGGTLVKVDEGEYKHQKEELCRRNKLLIKKPR
jgi:hypothetical protein